MQLFYKPPIACSILDVCLNVYLSLNLLPKLLTDNNVQSLNYVTGINDLFVYDTEFIADEFMANDVVKNDYKFCTGSQRKANASFVSSRYLLIESGDILRTESGINFLI